MSRKLKWSAQTLTTQWRLQRKQILRVFHQRHAKFTFPLNELWGRTGLKMQNPLPTVKADLYFFNPLKLRNAAKLGCSCVYHHIVIGKQISIVIMKDTKSSIRLPPTLLLWSGPEVREDSPQKQRSGKSLRSTTNRHGSQIITASHSKGMRINFTWEETLHTASAYTVASAQQ